MPAATKRARITAVTPLWAIEGGRVRIEGHGFPVDRPELPEVRIGNVAARIVHASAQSLSVLVPPGLEGGRTPVRVEGVPGETAFIELGRAVATGLHQVDNPAFDREGNLYVTYSGTRGQQVPVSVFRVTREGVRESFVTGIVNATSMTFDREGRLFVSSRFDGTIYRVASDGSVETIATDLGVACGLAFAADGSLYVGDRSGTIFRLDSAGHTVTFATLPPSVAAFHLAVGPDDCLYVTGPTLAPRDDVYRVRPDGKVEVIYRGFGRPQGLAFDAQGALHVVEALAGWSGLYRLRDDGSVEHMLAGPDLVGVVFAPDQGLVVASNDTAYRLDVNVRSL